MSTLERYQPRRFGASEGLFNHEGLPPKNLMRFLLTRGKIKVVYDRPFHHGPEENIIEPGKLQLEILKPEESSVEPVELKHVISEGVTGPSPTIIVVGLLGQEHRAIANRGVALGGFSYDMLVQQISPENKHPIREVADISILKKSSGSVRYDELVIGDWATYHNNRIIWTYLIRHNPEQITEPNIAYLTQIGEDIIDRPPNWRITDTLVLCTHSVGYFRDDKNNYIHSILIPGLPVAS